MLIAFVMGLGGTINVAMSGHVDIRLAMLILLASLFGIRLGAIGTTYVRPYMIKVVMATISMIVSVSRAIVIPVYLMQLGYMAVSDGTISATKIVSFVLMVAALAVGALIILAAMVRGHREAPTA